MNLFQVLNSDNSFFYIVEVSDQNRFAIENGVLILQDISEVDTGNRVLLPTKTDLARFGNIVEAFIDEKYPDVDIEIHKPGVSQRLEKLGIKCDYSEYERQFLQSKILEWLEENSEYKDTLVPVELIFS